MDGPDLSHLLDDANSEKPPEMCSTASSAAAAGYRLVAARTAASSPCHCARLAQLWASGSAVRGWERWRRCQAPSAAAHHVQSHIDSAPSPAGLGKAPDGLGWVNAGSATDPRRAWLRPRSRPLQVVRAQASCRLTSAFSSSGTSLCSNLEICSLYSPYGSIGDVRLRRQFTRTSDGVTVRAFTALWPWRPSSSSRLRRGLPPRPREQPGLNRAPRFPRFPRGRCRGTVLSPKPLSSRFRMPVPSASSPCRSGRRSRGRQCAVGPGSRRGGTVAG